MSIQSIPIVEIFHSLQGEGVHVGRSAVFVRLAGCTVGCPWCDTKESWPRNSHPHLPITRVVAEVAAFVDAGASFVVITGGEPLEHDLTDLCAALQPIGVPLHLETSGVGSFTGSFAWITLSPKSHNAPRTEVLATCNELKVVVHKLSDLSFAEAMAKEARQMRHSNDIGPELILQPGWESAQGSEIAIDYVRTHPEWRLGLQAHKLIGLR